MFIGHFGIGFGAKKAAPGVSLGVFFIAAQFLDLLWPNLLLLNVEHVAINNGTSDLPLDFTDYPVSHSLLMVILWAIVVGGIYWLFRRNKSSAIVIGLCVISHWLLDLVVHIPDLPLYPGDSPKLGMGLWHSVPGTLLVEGVIFTTGLFIYASATRAKNKKGKYGLWILAILLLFTHVASLFGPVPASVHSLAWAAQLQWLFIILAFWVDNNRFVKAK